MFEDRVVPAAPLVINAVDLTNFQVSGDALLADGTVTGTLAGLPFTAEIADFALQLVNDNPATQAVECSVLDLELGPINVALLGLFVDTSPICLEVTAVEGGGLLGDLLCGLAGDNPLGLPILPLAGQEATLQNSLGTLFNGALNHQPPGQGGGGDVCTGECEILDLSLGPVELTLLGVNVSLDDCANGPVQVCVSASAGDGLLGDLLCGLSSSPALNLNIAEVTQFLDSTTDALADGILTGREQGQLTRLVNRLAFN